ISPAGIRVLNCRIAVRISEGIFNEGYRLGLRTRGQLIWFERKIRCGFNNAISVVIGITADSLVEGKTRASINGLGWIAHSVWLERGRVRICRINSIVSLVTFERSRDGSDFCFGTGTRAFFLDVTDRAQNQSA